MPNTDNHDGSHYRSLITELQRAKKEGFVFELEFLDHDLKVKMSDDTPDSKISEVAEHISKKYRVFAEAKISSKIIMIYDVYSLDPRV